ncbi:MAG TPA: hypothetical protein VFW77_01190 [Candidatus Saccharimonadales bacterium]|nr:hypothetical protein [Candidatus Saccharimonadales bacterium]
MKSDGKGNLIFVNGEGLDVERAKVIDRAFHPTSTPRSGDGSSEETWQKRRVAKAMVDAGLTPDIDVSDARPVTSRVEDFVRGGAYGTSTLVIRHDEIEEVSAELGGALDYDSVLQRWHHDGQNSRAAQELLGEIAALQAGEPVETPS